MKIQRITVVDPSSATPTVEMTFADHPFANDATQVVVASLRLDAPFTSLEHAQRWALGKLKASIETAYSDLLKPPAHDPKPVRRVARS